MWVRGSKRRKRHRGRSKAISWRRLRASVGEGRRRRRLSAGGDELLVVVFDGGRGQTWRRLRPHRVPLLPHGLHPHGKTIWSPSIDSWCILKEPAYLVSYGGLDTGRACGALPWQERLPLPWLAAVGTLSFVLDFPNKFGFIWCLFI